MKKIKDVALVICGFLIGLSITLLLRKNAGMGESTKIIDLSDVRKLENQFSQKEKQTQFLMDVLDKKNALLNTQLQSLTAQLSQARAESRNLQKRTMDLAAGKKSKDTMLLLADYDTLKAKVVLLNNAIVVSDSLCDRVIDNQQQQLIQKDSVIQLHRMQYVSLKSSFTESISQQKLLLDQNDLLRKQVRKQRLKSKLLSGLTLIAAGITTHYLLK